jgi:hypothetical protein
VSRLGVGGIVAPFVGAAAGGIPLALAGRWAGFHLFMREPGDGMFILEYATKVVPSEILGFLAGSLGEGRSGITCGVSCDDFSETRNHVRAPPSP